MTKKVNKIYYIYKIHFLCGYPSGRYYIGKKTYVGKHFESDTYTGSGNFCKSYFKKYGKVEGVTYIKEILEINPSFEINKDREKYWIGNLWQTDPLCMNQMEGGFGNNEHFRNKNTKKIKQYDLNGNLIKVWNSISEAADILNATNLQSALSGRVKTAAGYIWRYLNDPFDKFPIPKKVKDSNGRKRRINQYTKDDEFIKTWDSITEAAKEINGGKNATDILSSFLSGKIKNKTNVLWGYKWKYYDRDGR